jgi:hypothetical protein
VGDPCAPDSAWSLSVPTAAPHSSYVLPDAGRELQKSRKGSRLMIVVMTLLAAVLGGDGWLKDSAVKRGGKIHHG